MACRNEFGHEAMLLGVRLKCQVPNCRVRLSHRTHHWWFGRIVTNMTKVQIFCLNLRGLTGTFRFAGLCWASDLTVYLMP